MTYLNEKIEVLEMLEILELYIDGKVEKLPIIKYKGNNNEDDIYYKLNIVYNKLIKKIEDLENQSKNSNKINNILDYLKNIVKEEIKNQSTKVELIEDSKIKENTLTQDLLKAQIQIKNNK